MARANGRREQERYFTCHMWQEARGKGAANSALALFPSLLHPPTSTTSLCGLYGSSQR